MAIRAVIADDERIFRAGLRNGLDQAEDIEVVGEAATPDDLLHLSRSLQPDVLVLGPRMVAQGVTSAVARLRHELPNMRVLMVGAGDPAKAREALSSGAAGYVDENAPCELLVEAVRAVAEGGVWLSDSIAEGLFGGGQATPAEGGERLLTPREQQVLSLMAQGHDNETIARLLCLGRQTVRNYVSRIYGKLGVRHRGEAIVWARKHGFESD